MSQYWTERGCAQESAQSKGVTAQMKIMAKTQDLKAIKAPPSPDKLYPHGLKSLSPPGKRMDAIIKELGHVRIQDFEKSNFVKPESVYYEIGGTERRWDVVGSHDSIAVVIYHKEMDSLLLVRQFRPALYATKLRSAAKAGSSCDVPLAQGFTCELCAGLVDKEKSMEEIVKEEILEECGYDVDANSITHLTTYAAGVGIQGAFQSLYYTEVDESMKVQESGGLEDHGERIEVLALPLANVDAFVTDSEIAKTSGAMFGLYWAKTQGLPSKA